MNRKGVGISHELSVFVSMRVGICSNFIVVVAVAVAVVVVVVAVVVAVVAVVAGASAKLCCFSICPSNRKFSFHTSFDYLL